MFRPIVAAPLLALMYACSGPAATPAEPTAAVEQDIRHDQSAALEAWFETQWEAQLSRSPETQTFLGRKTNYGLWDDPSDAFAMETIALTMRARDTLMETFDRQGLNAAARLSYDLFIYNAEQAEKSFAFRRHVYRFTPITGPHSGIPAFLINQHRIDAVSDAEAYVERLAGINAALEAHRREAEAQAAIGVLLPRWAYPQMIETARNIIAGAPFEPGEKPSALLEDFTAKVGILTIEDTEKDALIEAAVAAMLSSVAPAYRDLITMFELHGTMATDDDGAWKFPDGRDYYAVQLERMTTTDLTADQIHAIGLDDVARIHAEMKAIKDSVGFKGDLRAFFAYLRDDPDARFTYPNTDEGRARYLAEASGIIDTMRRRLDELFITKPRAEMVVRRVEPFRERSAGKAFYQRPAPDGSRPGIYYANLYDMASMPIYQMEALAYHEGIPGHHMQIAIAQELDNVPSFRRFGGVTAFSEGWGLYSELIGKELGFYSDPYSDFGRLSMELWRAARLVVDTGLHDKRWTREEAIAWLVENTPNPEDDARKAIERYVVLPGQATAYKIGMLKILELRKRAQESLGAEFDIREFHDVVLRGGAVPLAILDQIVTDWIAGKHSTRSQ